MRKKLLPVPDEWGKQKEQIFKNGRFSMIFRNKYGSTGVYLHCQKELHLSLLGENNPDRCSFRDGKRWKIGLYSSISLNVFN